MQQDRIYELFQQRAKMRHPFEVPNMRAVVVQDREFLVANPERLMKDVYDEAKGRAQVLSRLVTAGVRAWGENFGSIDRTSFEGLFQKPNSDDAKSEVNYDQPAVEKLVKAGSLGSPGNLLVNVNEAVKDSLLEEFLVQAEEARRDGNDRRFSAAVDVATGVLIAQLPLRLGMGIENNGFIGASRHAVSELHKINPDLAVIPGKVEHSEKVILLLNASHLMQETYDPVATNLNALQLMQEAVSNEPGFLSHPSYMQGLTIDHYSQMIQIDAYHDPEVSETTAFIMEKWLGANISDPADLKGSGRFLIPNGADRYAARVGVDLVTGQSNSLLKAVTGRIEFRQFMRMDPDLFSGGKRPGH